MRRTTRCLLLGIPMLIVGAIFALRPSADADEKDRSSYHVILFASEREGNAPRFSHTWATFVKSTQPESGKPTLNEAIPLSWLPANGVIPPLATVPGRNFSLSETMDWTRQMNARVAAWGPIPVRKELYDLARQRKEVLESGRLAYKMIDGRVRPDRGTNCIHAVSDMVPGSLLETGTAHGEGGTQLVAEHFRGYLIRAEASDPDILALVGIDWNSIEHRSLAATVRR